MHSQHPIIALATPHGKSAIAVVRLSGTGSIELVNQVFKGKNLTQQASHTVHFGTIYHGATLLDEVLVTLFIAPHSFTKEDSIEIATHGSIFIVEQVIQLLVKQGAALAQPGEFTQRAFLNGRFDLAQAEGVADLIASEAAITHTTAIQQMRGGFSTQIKLLRTQLIHFAAMLELELDFAEEDVAFANRDDLKQLGTTIITSLTELIDSFQLGNVLQKGVPIVLAGKPNAGKSTLLNALLQEEKAIVSPIPGTTRDLVEGMVHLGGIPFRFIDTAGLREQTNDEIEAIGIMKTKEQLQKAALILYMFDATSDSLSAIHQEIQQLKSLNIPFISVVNKMDIATWQLIDNLQEDNTLLSISAKKKEGIALLKDTIINLLQTSVITPSNTIIVNARHYASLHKSREALQAVMEGIAMELTNELLVVEIRKALHHLGEITGEVTTEDLLGDIFSKFCIGK